MVTFSVYNEGVYNFFIYNLAPSSGTGIALDGKGKYLATEEATLNFGNAWSIGVWCRPEPDDEFRTLLTVENRLKQSRIKISTAPVSDESNFIFNRPTDLRVEMSDQDGIPFRNEGFQAIFQDRTWAYVSVTWDGSSLVSYLDGVSGTTSVVISGGTGVLADIPRNVFYGFGLTGGVAAWSGTIGPASIWDSVLGPEEWTTVVSGQFAFDPTTASGSYTSAGSLVQHWPLQNESSLGENLATSGTDFTKLRNVSTEDLVIDIPGNEGL